MCCVYQGVELRRLGGGGGGGGGGGIMGFACLMNIGHWGDPEVGVLAFLLEGCGSMGR